MFEYVMDMNGAVVVYVIVIGSFLLSIPVWEAYCNFRKWAVCMLFHKQFHVTEYEQGGYYSIECEKCNRRIKP